MNLFLLFAVIFLALALLFVLLPLMGARARTSAVPAALVEATYRAQFDELESDLAAGVLDRTQYETSRRELDVRYNEELAAARAVPQGASGLDDAATLGKLALALGLCLPIAAAGLYAWRGQPQALNEAPPAVATADGATSAAPGMPHDVNDQQIRAMVMKLAEELKKNPGNLEGWFMLGRSLATLGNFPQAAKAYQQALKLAPDEPVILADYADLLANMNGGNLEGEPMQYINQALKGDPKNIKALALAGEAAYRRKDYDKAIEYWTLQKSVLGARPDTPPQRIAAVETSINDARAAKGLPPLPSSVPAGAAEAQQTPQAPFLAAMAAAGQGGGNAAPAAPAGPGQTIGVRVSISPKLAGKFSPGDALFIFARAPGAAGMPPLAVIRTTAAELPKTYTLDDSMSMAPMFRLSGSPEANIGARISKSGVATPNPGDLSGTIGPVKLGSQGLELVIDHVE